MSSGVESWSRGRLILIVAALVVISFLGRNLASADQFATPIRVIAGIVGAACLVAGIIIAVRWVRARNREEM